MMSYQSLADLTTFRRQEILRETEGGRLLRRYRSIRRASDPTRSTVLTRILGSARLVALRLSRQTFASPLS